MEFIHRYQAFSRCLRDFLINKYFLIILWIRQYRYKRGSFHPIFWIFMINCLKTIFGESTTTWPGSEKLLFVKYRNFHSFQLFCTRARYGFDVKLQNTLFKGESYSILQKPRHLSEIAVLFYNFKPFHIRQTVIHSVRLWFYCIFFRRKRTNFVL